MFFWTLQVSCGKIFNTKTNIFLQVVFIFGAAGVRQAQGAGSKDPLKENQTTRKSFALIGISSVTMKIQKSNGVYEDV